MAAVRVIRIHPVKAFDAVRVDEARVLASGALEFDRRWAFFDGRGRFVNGKNREAVHGIRAEYDLGRLEVACDGRTFSLKPRDGRLARWMSERLGERVEFRENAELGFPDDTDSPGPTFVSEASLARAAEWFGFPVAATRARFRANIEFDGVDAFWEDRLYGSWFRAGGVQVYAVNPCQRCVVPSRDPRTGVQDAGFQKRFAELRQAHLPDWAVTAPFNHYYRFAVNTRIPAEEAGKAIRVGDTVSFGNPSP
jgi:MOSC domain-containing protein